MGIEPTQPAWKAGALPLSYTRVELSFRPRSTAVLSAIRFSKPHNIKTHKTSTAPVYTGFGNCHLAATAPDYQPRNTPWWRELDLNQRRHSQRVYSPSPLTTRAPLHRRDIQLFCQPSRRRAN